VVGSGQCGRCGLRAGQSSGGGRGARTVLGGLERSGSAWAALSVVLLVLPLRTASNRCSAPLGPFPLAGPVKLLENAMHHPRPLWVDCPLLIALPLGFLTLRCSFINPVGSRLLHLPALNRLIRAHLSPAARKLSRQVHIEELRIRSFPRKRVRPGCR
jgi:hypothetical protein